MQQSIEPDSGKSKRPQPGSTFLLLVTIIFSPILWLVDPGAMANFWVARRPKDD